SSPLRRLPSPPLFPYTTLFRSVPGCPRPRPSAARRRQARLPDEPGHERRGTARSRARHRRGRRHRDGQAGAAVSRHRAPREGSLRRARVRLPGERRVLDDQGGRRARLGGRESDCARSAPVHQARRRERDPDVLRAGRGTLAPVTGMKRQVDRYGVMGYPVSHSRSPIIHRLFALQTGQNISYELLPVAPGELRSAIREFGEKGGKGLNITVPHKTAARDVVAQLSERATRAGAVNTLVFQDGEIFGDNTDGVGLLRDLTRNLGLHLASLRILILGAGGATRG